MFLSDISIKRPIMMSMLLTVFLLFGGIAYFGMPLDLLPDVDIPYITIQTVYPGAGPNEIETQITKKIEDAVSSISKIDLMTSYSMEGISISIIKFEMSKNVDVANQEIKDKIDAILNDLPDDADSPIVEKIDLQEFPVVEIIFAGDLTPTELYEIADKTLKDRFSQIPGVARADISGGQEREIQVAFSDKTIFENKISLEDMAAIIAGNNMDMPGGNFERRSQEYTVRLTGEYESLHDIAELEIPTVNGNKKIKDIATIQDAGSEVRERTTFYNNVEKVGSDNVILISLIKNTEGNTVDIARSAYEIIPEIEAILPAGTNLNVVTDESVFIKSTVDDTISNILLGILLTGLVLLFFLHDVRSTIIVALAMPMSIISAFMLMGMMDFTKNIMSLMGLSTAVGVLVSNSVVVLENIFRKRRQGLNNKQAASIGTSEVVVAVLAATATNIAVFLPVAGMSSLVGAFFKEFALTVTFATLFSLIISFTLTPMMASLILKENDGKKKKKGIGDRIEAMLEKMEAAYRRVLIILLKGKKRSAMIFVSSLLILVGSFMLFPSIGFEFFPMMDEGDIVVEVELPVGYKLNETADILDTITNRLKKNEDIKHLIVNLGKISDIDIGTNMAVITIKLTDVEKRKTSTEETSNNIIKELSDVPNILLRSRAISSMGGEGGLPIQFYLKGQNTDTLEIIKTELYDKIKDVQGIANLNTSSRSGKPEISIIPDRQKLYDAGISVYQIAIQLRGAFTGLVSSQYREAGEEFDIRVLAEDASYDSPAELGKLSITANGKLYTLEQLADIEFTEGFSKILRIDKYKTIQFSSSTAAGVPMGDVMNLIQVEIDALELPPGYIIEWGGDAEEMNKTMIDMLFTLILAIVLTYMLLAAILENLVQPILVLGTFPLAMIGVIFGMLLSGLTMNIISMMAIVMLLGIVVNNAILILDMVNVLVKEKNMSIYDALIEACPAKIRPILMSSIAIILGMIPMALGMGSAGREVRQPMGVVSIGGLVISTILTLFVVPAVYHLFTKNKSNQQQSAE